MHNSKLVETIKHFDPKELDNFDRFVRSPFFHEDDKFEDVVQLFEHIRECLYQEEMEGLDKEVVYQHVYPNATFVSGKLDKLMSRLMKIVRKFITYEHAEIKDNQVQQLLSIAKFYRLKELDKRYQDTVRQLKKIQQNTKRPNTEFYLDQYFIEKEIAAFTSINNKHKGDINLQATIESLDIHYVVNKLHYICVLLSQNMDVSLDLNQTLIAHKEIEQLLNRSSYLKIPLIISYHQAILMLRNVDGDNDEPFFQFKKLLKEYTNILPSYNLKALQALVRNYCVVRRNSSIKYLEEAFFLYKEHLEEGYLYYGGQLIPSTIFTLVQVGLDIKEYDWVKEILESHKNRITGTQYPEEVYRFNMAKYHFHTRAFKKALNFLSDQYEDTFYNIAARRQEIKIYYEEQSVLLDSKMDAFKVFIFRISRKLLSEIHKTSNNNFINFLRQVNNPKTMKNTKRIDKLRDKIIEEQTISEKTWLLEKLEDLR